MSDETPVAPPAPPAPPPAPVVSSDEPDSTTKLLAALSYLFGVVAIIVLLIEPYKNQRFAKFHAVQAIGLWVVGFAVNILWAIPVIGWIIAPIASIALFVFAVIAIINAFQGKYYEVPLLYNAIKSFIDS